MAEDAQLNQRRWGYHALSAPKLFEAGVAMPDGWSPVPAEIAPVSPVEAPHTPEPPKADPFDYDGDGAPGGSLPREKRKYTRKAR